MDDSGGRSAQRVSFRSIPPVVRTLILLSIPVSIASGFFGVYVSAFLLELGVDAGTIGLVLAVNGATMVLAAIPLGIRSDRRGRKTMLILGSLLFSPMLLILAMTTETAWLLVVGVLAGLSEAAFLSTWNAMIADGTPAEARNAAFSLSFIVGTTTSGIGYALPVAFPALSVWTGLSIAALHNGTLLLFALATLLAPLGLVVLLRGYREPPRSAAPIRVRLPPRERIRQIRKRAGELHFLLMFSAVNGLVGLGAGFIIPLMATWFSVRFGIQDNVSGPLLAIANLTMGLAGVTSARLARRMGAVRAIAFVQGLSTVFMFSLAFAPDPLSAGVLYVIRAALMNMASPIMDSYLMGLIRPDERGFASALNSIVWRMPNSASTIGGGYLLDQKQTQSPFLIAGSLYAAGVSLFYLMFRDVHPTEERAGAQPRRAS